MSLNFIGSLTIIIIKTLNGKILTKILFIIIPKELENILRHIFISNQDPCIEMIFLPELDNYYESFHYNSSRNCYHTIINYE